MRTATKVLITTLAIVAGALFLTTGPAGAQEVDPYVSNNEVTQNPELSPQVESASVSNAPSSLAFTGGDVAGLALIGGFAIALGGLLIVSRRRVATTA